MRKNSNIPKSKRKIHTTYCAIFGVLLILLYERSYGNTDCSENPESTADSLNEIKHHTDSNLIINSSSIKYIGKRDIFKRYKNLKSTSKSDLCFETTLEIQGLKNIKSTSCYEKTNAIDLGEFGGNAFGSSENYDTTTRITSFLRTINPESDALSIGHTYNFSGKNSGKVKFEYNLVFKDTGLMIESEIANNSRATVEQVNCKKFRKRCESTYK